MGNHIYQALEKKSDYTRGTVFTVGRENDKYGKEFSWNFNFNIQ